MLCQAGMQGADCRQHYLVDRLGGHLRRAGRRRDRLYLPDGDGRRDGRKRKIRREKNSTSQYRLNVMHLVTFCQQRRAFCCVRQTGHPASGVNEDRR